MIGSRHYAGSYADRDGGEPEPEGRSAMRVVIGWLIAGVMIAATACATTPAPAPEPTSVNVSGTWVGVWWAFEGEGGAGELRGIFRQDGTNLYGNFEIKGRKVNRTFVSGVVTGNEVHLGAPAQGLLVVNGDEMTGTVQGIVEAQITLHRQP